jgi:hypothetical protein
MTLGLFFSIVENGRHNRRGGELKMWKIKTALFMAVLAVTAVSCSGSGTQMIQTHMEAERVGTPIKDVLIISIIDMIRRSGQSLKNISRTGSM